MNKFALTALTWGVCLAVPSAEGIGEYTFKAFGKEFNKTYADEAVSLLRRDVFEANMELINQHNSKPGVSWSMKMNTFGDLTAQEFSDQHGYDKTLARAQQRQRVLHTPTMHPLDSPPESLDWRSKHVVTSVKNQGFCGSCWAFGSVESIESRLAIKTGALATLSEQQLVSCVTDEFNPKHCGGTGGCKGATAEVAFGYVQNKGIATEEDYPYTAGDDGDNGRCDSDHPISAHITGFVALPPNNITAVVNALVQGPLTITVDAGAWQFYDKGVYSPKSYATVDLDHVVQLVGYGVDPTHGEYWLVRNSWDVIWGEDGYIRLQKTDGSSKYCGLDSKPQDGSGCDGGPTTITACGTSGILYDVSYPTV